MLLLLLAGDALAEPLTVCTFSFNTPDEVEAFKRGLPEEDFEIVDLSPRRPLPSGDGTDTSWFPALCRADLQCDLVVYSAEFAGRFFGKYGFSLSLQEMEEASCQAQCEGLFQDAQEVFLLACNTLATKDEDRRTPEEYLQVLLDHGFDRAAAERVVVMRYGPLGPSFREALRRIFMGVPRIYGFSSVAPTSTYTVPLLERYFRSKGDYLDHLYRAAGDTGPNRELLTAFAGTGLVQKPGLSALEPALADRAQICALYDETRSVAARLRLVQHILDRSDFFAFLPTIEVFIGRHPAEGLNAGERRIFTAIQQHDAARDQVLELVRGLIVSALKIEMANLAVHLGWMTREEFRAVAVEGARELLAQRLTSELVDIMCEIGKHEAIGSEFGSGDLPERLFQYAEGIRMVRCLAPTDEAVSARLLAGFDSMDGSAHEWAAYALSQRLPLDDAILLRIAPHLNHPSAEVRARLQWMFRTQRPLSEDVLLAVQAYDATLAEELGRREQPRRRGRLPW